ncbi:MAG: type 1 glutamine amidotransferase [Dehalococcoidia bacterium]|nr:MAG: type 1 glutamine amidotransferase [Dehalococcoidia bacterium]
MLLAGQKAVVLAEDMYEDLELWYPVLRLREEGAEVIIAGTGISTSYTGLKGYPLTVDATVDQVSAEEVDAVIVPGGYAPDKLRRYPAVLRLVREAYEQGKVVAAICHAPWVLVSAGILKGKRVTSFYAIADDVRNAGADRVDAEVVRDGNIITSRQPSDLGAFCREIIGALTEST